MDRSSITKQASLKDIATDAVRSAGQTFGEIDLRRHPFRSVFKFLAPGLLMASGHWMLAILMGLAEEVLGVGPSTIGDMIDQALNIGETGQISDSGLQNASESIVDRILSGSIARSSILRERIVRNGGIELEDLLAAWAHGPDKENIKEAGVWRDMWRWMKRTGRGRRLPIVALFYQLLKAIGIGLGLTAGIKFLGQKLGPMVGKPMGGLPDLSRALTPKKTPDQLAGFAEWDNTGGVEQTIISVLNRAVKDRNGRPFSVLFSEAQGRPLKGSPAMRRLLEDISMAHGWAPISEIDRYKTFVAPNIAEAAKRLLPQLRYSTRKTMAAEERLGKVLGGQK